MRAGHFCADGERHSTKKSAGNGANQILRKVQGENSGEWKHSLLTENCGN